MKKHYKFTRSCTCDRVPYNAGDIVPEDEIEAGSVVSMLSTGWIVEATAPTKPEPKQQPEPTPEKAVEKAEKPSAKK